MFPFVDRFRNGPLRSLNELFTAFYDRIAACATHPVAPRIGMYEHNYAESPVWSLFLLAAAADYTAPHRLELTIAQQ